MFAFALAVGASGTAAAATDGKIAFDRSLRIWTKQPNPSAAETMLRDDGASDSAPAYSPEGSRVAFVRRVPGPEIFVVPAAGAAPPRRLTTNTLVEDEPDWSPDGTRLVFERGAEIWSMNADGGAQAELSAPKAGDSPEFDSNQPSLAPAWSPAVPGAGAGVIAFIHQGVIWTMDADGTDKQPLAHSCPDPSGICDPAEAEPAWAPDGTRLSLTYLGDIYVIDLADGITRPLLATEDGRFEGSQTASEWAPGGSLVAFQSAPPAGSPEIAVARADLTSVRPRLLTDTSAPAENPDWQPRPECTNDDATAGPDVITGTPRGDVLCGGDGNDTIEGLAGSDLLLGGDGQDRLVGGFGNDTLDGGQRRDLVGYGASTEPVRASLADGFAYADGRDALLGLEGIDGSPFGDILEGSPAADVLRGFQGADVLDVRDGIGGNDTASGGAQVDTCRVDSGDTRIGCP
jgi:hypothetical protein